MLTPAAKRLLAPLAERDIAAVKDRYRQRLERLKQLFQPALTNAELSAGLGLQAPAPGQFGGSEVGRFVSTAPRMRRARPSAEVRALIDALVDGQLLLACKTGSYGERREVLVCSEQDLNWLDTSWSIVDPSNGEPVQANVGRDWDDDQLWDLFDDGPAVQHAPVKQRPLLGQPRFPIGFGAMRLSTLATPYDQAEQRLLEALDAGMRVIDTADSYGLDHTDLHANERRIAAALERWNGPAQEVLVATKVGLSRPDGRWVPDGRPEHLRASALASCEALGVDQLALLQLHVVDPKVGLRDSLEALVTLRDEGRARFVGLCNVDLIQLEQALAIAPIDAVQLGLSVFSKQHWDTAAACLRLGIPVLAHSPLGGHAKKGKAATDPVLTRIAERHGRSPYQVALAALLELAPNLLPLPGATRSESLTDSAAAATLRLEPADHEALDGRFPWLADARAAFREAWPAEVVMITGPPAAGKTTRVRHYVERSYLRLNRDERGGRLKDLHGPLDEALATGTRHVVLDNTYPTAKTRQGVIDIARRHGVPVRVEHMATHESDVLVNAAGRVLERMGQLPSPAELTQASKSDPNMLPPAAIARYFQLYQPATTSQGLDDVREFPFVRRSTGDRAAILFDLDGTLRISTGPAPFPMRAEEVELLPGRAERLQRLHADGMLLLGVSNQAGVAKGSVTVEQVEAAIAETNRQLGLDIDVRYCPHDAGKIACWCRKPMPGMGIALIRDHGLDPSQCTMVGDRSSDAEFAQHLGMRFVWAKDFFA